MTGCCSNGCGSRWRNVAVWATCWRGKASGPTTRVAAHLTRGRAARASPWRSQTGTGHAQTNGISGRTERVSFARLRIRQSGLRAPSPHLVRSDEFSRECLALVIDTSLSGALATRGLTSQIGVRGKPHTLVSDNSTELTSSAVLRWSQERRVEWHCIAPGKPIQNGFLESYNGRLWDESCFASLAHARLRAGCLAV
ncbi:DDE-type integrase/transposase/recombinase [Aurantiacibacter zhengii]|uniref:Transposase n=1 Tax=Aurantiacibacter zhengii TaxID=2307003 RepID=A0A418NU04_9SPHN|nr:transposase [Aurantiacibacter zhengii]